MNENLEQNWILPILYKGKLWIFISHCAGIPAAGDLISIYCRCRGIPPTSVPQLNFFLALSIFKMAAIAQVFIKFWALKWYFRSFQVGFCGNCFLPVENNFTCDLSRVFPTSRTVTDGCGHLWPYDPKRKKWVKIKDKKNFLTCLCSVKYTFIYLFISD